METERWDLLLRPLRIDSVCRRSTKISSVVSKGFSLLPPGLLLRPLQNGGVVSKKMKI